MGSILSPAVVQLIAAALVFAGVVVTALYRYAVVSKALRGVAPKDRPAVLRALTGLFKTDWHVGAIKRTAPQEGTNIRTGPVQRT